MMRKIATAINISNMVHYLKDQPELFLVEEDAFRQENLWENLKKESYKEAEILLLIDTLEGPFSKQELVEEVKKTFSGEIVMLLNEGDDESFILFLRQQKITRIFTTEDELEEVVDALIFDGQKPKLQTAERELVEVIEKVYLSKETIVIVGPGGVGKTSIALELANTFKNEKADVCIVDLNFEKADIGALAGVSESGVQTLIKMKLEDVNVKDAITTKNGISYITGLRDLMDINDAYNVVKPILRTLKKQFDIVIVDTGSFTNASTHAALVNSDRQLFILNNSERHVVAIKRYLELYESLDIKLNAKAIINLFVEGQYEEKEIAEILEIDVYGAIRFDKKTRISMDKNKGLIKATDKKVIDNLKDDVFGNRKKGFSLFGLRKR